MRKLTAALLTLLAPALIFAAWGAAAQDKEPAPKMKALHAVAHLHGRSGSDVKGTIHFAQKGDLVHGTIQRFDPATARAVGELRHPFLPVENDDTKSGALGVAVLADSLTVVGFAYTHRGQHATQETPRPEPRRTPVQDAGSGESGTTSERYDFYQMLPNFEVVVPEKERDVKRDLPAAAKIERPGVFAPLSVDQGDVHQASGHVWVLLAW